MAVTQGVKLKDHTVLALDIGTRFLKIAELRLARGAISLLTVAVSPTPPGVVDSNQILDPVGLGRAIKSMMATHKIRTRKAIVSISGQSSVVVRPIDLPKMSVKELTDTMRFEVERHIPFTADEVVMDYAPIIDPDELPDDETNMKVLLAVAQEELIKSYLKTIAVAGLQPVALDVEILASIRALVDIHQRTNQLDNTLALVSIGAVSTDISIVNQGNLIFTRSVPIAGDTLTEAIADQLGRSFEEAEELKKSYGRIFLEHEEAPAGDAAPAAPAPDLAGGGLFDAFGGGAADGLTLASAPAAPLFSLDGPPADQGGGLNLDAPPLNLDAPALNLDAPALNLDAPAGPAGLEADDGVDDELPVFRFGLGDESEEPADIPVFSLDEDGVDDEVPLPGALAGPSGGAVFDLSSELEHQLPTYSRPARPEPEPTAPAAPPAASLPDAPADPFTQLQVPLTAASDLAPADGPEPGPGAMDALGALGGPTNLLDGFGDMGDPAQADLFQRRIFDSMMPTLVELVTEIRRSFEYFTSREPDTPIDRVIIYGGTSRLPHLVEFIQQELGLDVQQADPLQPLDLSHLRQPADYLQDLAPALPVCIGLGLRDMLA